ALWLERKWTFAAWPKLRSDEVGTRQAASRHNSAARHVANQRAGNGGCVGGVAQKIRQTQTERRSRAGDPLCRGRFSRHGADRLLLGTERAALQEHAGRLSRN